MPAHVEIASDYRDRDSVPDPRTLAVTISQSGETADTRIESGSGTHVIRLPEHHGPLSPILHGVLLQLLACHTAVARGTDVDKPRNLAKSATVE